MNIESGKIDRNFEVFGKLRLNGMVTGNVVVKKGALLFLHGMVAKDLIVEEGGMAIVHGIVNGSVYNRGGNIEIYGKIWGHVNGPAFIDAEAMIKGAVKT